MNLAITAGLAIAIYCQEPSILAITLCGIGLPAVGQEPPPTKIDSHATARRLRSFVDVSHARRLVGTIRRISLVAQRAEVCATDARNGVGRIDRGWLDRRILFADFQACLG